MPYFVRVFYRISLFTNKIMNGIFLSDIKATFIQVVQSAGRQRYNTRSSQRSGEERLLSTNNDYIYKEDKTGKNFFKSNLTACVPLLVNQVLKDSIFYN